MFNNKAIENKDEEIEKFRNLIYDYGKNNLSKLVKPSWEKNIIIPQKYRCHLAKYFLRLYSLETAFYKDMNKYLTNHTLGLYKVFINIIYSAMFNNTVFGCHDKTL